MAIRIRRVEGKLVALCAAESDAEEDDVYLNDHEDHALRRKFIKDYESEGVDFGYKKTKSYEQFNTFPTKPFSGRSYGPGKE